MPAPAPTFNPSQMGGFSPGMGGFGEHMDEKTIQSAMQQKSTQQQSSATNPQPTQPAHQPAKQPAPPREVGTFADELIQRPTTDIIKGLAEIFDINTLLGIKNTDTPEQQQRKKKLHQNFQQFTEEEKQLAQKKYQEAMEKKKIEEEEAERKRQAEEQKNQQAIAPPSGTQKGPVGPGSGQSKKQDAVGQLQQQRKTLGNGGQKH
jgi:hypothetical protein